MKITVDRPKCIGCGSCVAVCPQYFEMEADGKTHLLNSQRDTEEKDILVTLQPECIREAAGICPVKVIKIE